MQRDKENMSRVSKVSMPDFDGDNLQEYMEILYGHQKQCQKEGKYQQADMAKKKLNKLRVELDRQKKEQLVDKHQNEKKEVESAHIEEMAEFNKYWDEKMVEYQSQAQKLEDETLERHQAEMEEFESEIEKSIGHRQKQSGEIINLRRIEENLAKQENYTEAHKVQRQIQELQRNQYQKWNMMRNNKIRNLLNQLRTKQQNEANALRQRIEQGFEEQKKTRDVEQQKLIQKYINFMKELENHHRQEILKFQKATKMQSNMNYSKAVNMSRALQSIQRN